MTERSIVEAAARLRRQHEPYLVATVACVHGSSYRRPGARMLLTQFRWIAGSVSGGCLEGDISNKGWWRTREGRPVLVTYDSRLPENPDDDDVRAAFGLGCEGIVEVMLERAGAGGKIDPLEVAETCLRDRKRGAVVTVIRSDSEDIAFGARFAVREGEPPFGDTLPEHVHDAMLEDAHAAMASGESCNRSYAADDGTIEVLIEAILPPPRLFVFGTGHDALPVVELGRALGWDVVVCTPHGRVATQHRFVGGATEIVVGTPDEIAPRLDEHELSCAVVMGHHYEMDRAHLAMLLDSHVRYIGVLGPGVRTKRMLAELGRTNAVDDPRLHAPVGLELGSETPQEIALAIVAEIQAVLRSAPAVSLRDHIGAIHEHPSYDRVTERRAAVVM